MSNNYLDMSDEEFSKITESQFEELLSEEENTEEAEQEIEQEEVLEDDLEEGQEELEEDLEEEQEAEEELDEDEEDDIQEEEESQDLYSDNGSEEESDEEDESEEENKEESSDVDYESRYKELMAPLRADKKDIKINSPEELRRLAQMGIGYQAKMASIKPIRKIGQMLDNEGFLDEANVSFAIDLLKKDPKAINKLINDSGIDPLDIDTDGTSDYKPNAYTVNDTQLNLKDTLDDLEHSTSGQEALDIAGNKWDTESRDVLIKNPHMLKQLADQIEDGTYTKINDFIAEERAKGNIPDETTDLQAYITVGNHLHSVDSKPQTRTDSPKVTKTVKPDTSRTKRRKAAAPSKGKASPTESIPADPLNLDDAEFAKIMSKFI